MMWEIPEESTRVANFQAGRLDSFQMAFDSKGAMDQVEGIRYIAVPNGATEHLGFYGNWYVGHGEADFGERRPGYDPDLPWVSASPDVNSPEWEQARKVREALSIAIDRDLIVETLLGGEGSAQPLWMWENKLEFLDEDLRTIPYDPERAMQLLEEAGYPDGFEITLTPSIRGVAAEVEACEAISEMWEEIGDRHYHPAGPLSDPRPVDPGPELQPGQLSWDSGQGAPPGDYGTRLPQRLRLDRRIRPPPWWMDSWTKLECRPTIRTAGSS